VTEDPQRRRAILALIAVNLMWGISFPAMKGTNLIMAEHLASRSGGQVANGSDSVNMAARPPAAPGSVADIREKLLSASFLTTVRFGMSLVLLAVTVPGLFRGMTREQWWMGICTGLVFAPGFVMQNIGLNYVPASRSGFLTSLSVVFTPLAMVVLERRLPRALVIAGIVIGLVGTSILTGLIQIEGPFSIHFASDVFSELGPGDWLTAAAAVVFTGQILAVDSFSRRMPAGRLTPGMFVATLFCGAFGFGFAQCLEPEPRHWEVWFDLALDGRFLILLLVLSVFCTVLAFHCMNKYQGHVTPAQAALIYTTEPIFAAIWAMILPDIFSPLCGIDYPSERPGPEILIGGLVIVIGNVLALWPAKPTSGDATLPEGSTQ
jgi:drug/metabolite transporter (DMT)-like permease